jgi:hypothetical protein
MNNIIQEIMSKLGDNGLESLSNQVNAPKEKVSGAVENILPTLLGAMSKNVASKQGAKGLLNALDKDHSGDVFNNISGVLNNPDTAGASGILKHLLGGNQKTVETEVCKRSGLNNNQVSEIMKSVAPLLMGYLGNQRKQNQVNENNIGGLLTSLLGGSTGKSGGLDIGTIMNLVGAAQGGGKKQGIGGVLGMLGKVFRK